MTSPAVPRWQQALAIFVGMSIAINLVIYRLVGADRHIFKPAERLGYEMGSGIGLGLGITLVLWLLLLRRAPRKVSLLAFVVIATAGSLAAHYVRR